MRLLTMRLLTLALSVLTASLALARPQEPRVMADDFARLAGARWAGTLTYLDYGSQKEVSIRSDLIVTRSPDGSWVFEYVYPDEPKANGTKTVKLAEGGAMLGDEAVVERASLDGGRALRIVTRRRGKDNDREALFRFTYLLDASSFSIRKEVRPEGASEFFERNRYSWKR